MYNISEIKVVHLEVTTKCNAACPMCARTRADGKVKPDLPLTELTLDDIKMAFSKKFIAQLDRIYLCGYYGDPIVATETLEIFEYLRSCSKNVQLDMFTNASGRPAKWWKRLAELEVRVRFSVDGLEDTNHLYRRGTNFSKIKENMKTFINAGGWAEWDFIIFSHNEHQLEKALRLAEEIGFKRFHPKSTSRFFEISENEILNQKNITDKKETYSIKPPKKKDFQNPSLKTVDRILNSDGGSAKYFSETEINCRVRTEKSIYVSAEGYLFPCCWTGGNLYQSWNASWDKSEINQLVSQSVSDLSYLSIKRHSLKKILSNHFFQIALPESWEKGHPNRLKCCSKTCGKGYKHFESQFLKS